MRLSEIYQKYPRTMPIPRGERRLTSIAMSEDEYELVSRLAHHPETTANFGASVQGVIRWLVQCHAAELAQEAGSFQTLTNRLKLQLELYNLEIDIRDIGSFLDQGARALSLLLGADLFMPAVDHYRKMILFARKQPAPWNKVIIAHLAKHTELEKFRERVYSEDQELARELDLMME